MENLKVGEIRKNPEENPNILAEQTKISAEDFKRYMGKFLPEFSVEMVFDSEFDSDHPLSYDIYMLKEGEKIELNEKRYICIVESTPEKEGRALYLNRGFYLLKERRAVDE